MNLVSERITVDDYEDAVELFFERQWTDGLPVVLPTRRRVEAMIAHVGRDPQESLGAIPPRGGEATIEKLAINAVMGGARPEHFPVVLAAMEALLDPAHNLNGVSQTTHMCVSLVIVNGPIARELEFNSRDGVFVVVDGDPLRHQVHASSPSVGPPYARAAYHQLAESDLTASLFRTILGRIHT